MFILDTSPSFKWHIKVRYQFDNETKNEQLCVFLARKSREQLRALLDQELAITDALKALIVGWELKDDKENDVAFTDVNIDKFFSVVPADNAFLSEVLKAYSENKTKNLPASPEN